MSRIRTIKPEFWTSEQVMECSPLARLAFIGMWNFCDDQGVHPASVKTLKAEVFPADDISSAGVGQLVDELVANGLVAKFRANDKEWWAVTGWHHQLIKNPSAPKYPSPPSPSKPGDYPTPTPGLPPSYPSPTPGEDPVREGKGSSKGRERKGVEGEKSEVDSIPTVSREPDEPAAASPTSQRSGPAASRLPASWALPKAWGDWALKERPDWDEEAVRGVSVQFRDHWLARAGPTAVKADWQAAWRSWVRRERDPPVRINGRKPNAQEALEMANRAATSGWMPPELREQVG